MIAAQKFDNILEVTPAGGDKSDHHKPFLAPCPDMPGYTRFIFKQELPKDLIIQILLEIIKDIDKRHPPGEQPIPVYAPPFRLHTQKEAAAILGCAATSIRRLRLQGKIPYLPGRPVLILESDLFEYFNSNKRFAKRLPQPEPDEGPKERKYKTWEERNTIRQRRAMTKDLAKQIQIEREQEGVGEPVYNRRSTPEEKAMLRAAAKERNEKSLKFRWDRGQISDAEYTRRVQFKKRQETAERRQAKAAEREAAISPLQKDQSNKS